MLTEAWKLLVILFTFSTGGSRPPGQISHRAVNRTESLRLTDRFENVTISECDLREGAPTGRKLYANVCLGLALVPLD